MVILYVKGKKAAKEGNLSRELRGGYARKTLVFGFFTVDPFLIVFPVAMAVFGIIRTNLLGFENAGEGAASPLPSFCRFPRETLL